MCAYLWFFFYPRDLIILLRCVEKKNPKIYDNYNSINDVYKKKNSIIGKNDKKKVHNRNVYTMI